MFDFANHQPAAATALAADDDEWAFSSALPESLPSSNTISVSETSLSISLHAAREPQTPSVITMSLTFSNKTDQPISELTFMAAVTKVSVLLTCEGVQRADNFLRAIHSSSSRKLDEDYNHANKQASNKLFI